MDILDLIDRLEELATSARGLPMGGNAMIPRQKLLDLVDRMRVAAPREVYEARDIITKQQEVLAGAQDEAARLLAQAQTELETRMNDTAVIKAAEERARQIWQEGQRRAEELVKAAEEQARGRLDEAQEASAQQMREADDYALQTMRRLEQELEGFLSALQKGIGVLEQRAAERSR